MAKNKNRPDKGQAGKKPQAPLSQPSVKLEGISRRGWKVIGMGIGVVALGFFILSLTDPAGKNWASNLSPFLILGGYATIAAGIVLPDCKESASLNPPHP